MSEQHEIVSHFIDVTYEVPRSVYEDMKRWRTFIGLDTPDPETDSDAKEAPKK